MAAATPTPALPVSVSCRGATNTVQYQPQPLPRSHICEWALRDGGHHCTIRYHGRQMRYHALSHHNNPNTHKCSITAAYRTHFYVVRAAACMTHMVPKSPLLVPVGVSAVLTSVTSAAACGQDPASGPLHLKMTSKSPQGWYLPRPTHKHHHVSRASRMELFSKVQCVTVKLRRE